MYNFQNKTVREIALESPLTIRVFENHKIDFCCGGRIPFADACEKAGADAALVLTELEAALQSSPADASDPIEKKGPGALIDHIVCTHHAFTRSEIERLVPLANKVADRHGDSHSELFEIRDIFHQLGEELLEHMSKEERVLFPYIEKLESAAAANTTAPIPPFGTVNNPVRMMMFEHDQAGDMLRKMRTLSNDFTTPEDACPSYKGLYAGIEFLEKDLHLHIHLENNILFPQAIEMEKLMLAELACAAN